MEEPDEAWVRAHLQVRGARLSGAAERVKERTARQLAKKGASDVHNPERVKEQTARQLAKKGALHVDDVTLPRISAMTPAIISASALDVDCVTRPRIPASAGSGAAVDVGRHSHGSDTGLFVRVRPQTFTTHRHLGPYPALSGGKRSEQEADAAVAKLGAWLQARGGEVQGFSAGWDDDDDPFAGSTCESVVSMTCAVVPCVTLNSVGCGPHRVGRAAAQHRGFNETHGFGSRLHMLAPGLATCTALTRLNLRGTWMRSSCVYCDCMFSAHGTLVPPLLFVLVGTTARLQVARLFL